MEPNSEELAASSTTPLVDPLREGPRLVTAGEAIGVQLRLTGGVGIGCVSPTALQPPLKRTFKDIDLVGRGSQSKKIVELLQSLGYQPDVRFNAVNGATRLLLHDLINGRQLDVFLDEVDLCHHIDLRSRLNLSSPSLPVSDLLLMKLQVFETNLKDYADMAGLLADHGTGTDRQAIDLDYLGALAANDWGLWRTITIVAERTRLFARDLPDFPVRDIVETRLQTLLTHLEQVPKSRKWNLRAAVGERKRWYNLPE